MNHYEYSGANCSSTQRSTIWLEPQLTTFKSMSFLKGLFYSAGEKGNRQDDCKSTAWLCYAPQKPVAKGASSATVTQVTLTEKNGAPGTIISGVISVY